MVITRGVRSQRFSSHYDHGISFHCVSLPCRLSRASSVLLGSADGILCLTHHTPKNRLCAGEGSPGSQPWMPFLTAEVGWVPGMFRITCLHATKRQQGVKSMEHGSHCLG